MATEGNDGNPDLLPLPLDLFSSDDSLKPCPSRQERKLFYTRRRLDSSPARRPRSSSIDRSSTPLRASSEALPAPADEKPAGGFRSFSVYLQQEIKGGVFNTDEQMLQKEKHVAEFLRVPMKLEPLLLFGVSICLDAFLFTLSFLPLRIVVALASLAWRLVSGQRTSRGTLTSAVEKYDISRGIVIAGCVWLLLWIDVSVLYHWIRVQSTVKLYVIFNMLEIFDKLCRSFGQDIFDSLLYSFDPMKKVRLGWFHHFFTAMTVSYLHSLLLLGQIFTLNVAINSQSNSFITLLISNQFLELKSNVFRKLSNENLMSVTCSDMIERVQIFLSMFIIMLHNSHDLDWALTSAYFYNHLAFPFLAVLGSEIIIDWVKHCFATRFNLMTPEVYDSFFAILRKDVLRSNSQGELMDSARMSSDHLGFVPLPLTIILLRTLWDINPLSGSMGWATAILIFLCILASKVIVHLWLLGFCLRSQNKSLEFPPLNS
ncbi:MAG: TAPT1 family protein [archaeon]|nr:TAPT1 family protein [archaeon]